ncbi:MAG: IS3 family transposase, partial [Oligoflexales bacterium]
FFDSLKCEFVFDCEFKDLSDARHQLFDWIELFYNRKRIHSSIGYKTPPCFHEVAMAHSA